MKNQISWKIFLILLGLSLISVAYVLPYVLTIQGDIIKQIKQPLGLIISAQIIQSAILFSIAIFFGLILTKKINFQLPLLEAIIHKGDYKKVFKNILGISVLSGIIVAVAIYLLDMLFSLGGAAITTHEVFTPAWQRLLAAVYGGSTEEILMRLFLMTFFIWLGMKIFKKAQATKTIVWISIILAAIIFGLGHLPITASLTSITPLIVTRAIILNSVGGIVFGWLFWKKGLEAAMLAHFTTDIFLLTLLPLIIK